MICSICAESAGDDPLRCANDRCRAVLCDACYQAGEEGYCRPCVEGMNTYPDGTPIYPETAAQKRRRLKLERGDE